MQQYWTNFAKTGDPNGTSLPNWPRFESDKRRYLEFIPQGTVEKIDLRRAQCELFQMSAKASGRKGPLRSGHLVRREIDGGCPKSRQKVRTLWARLLPHFAGPRSGRPSATHLEI